MPFGTGHGSSIVFEQGPVYAVRGMDGMEWAGPAADVSHLATPDFRERVAPDLFDHAPFNLQFVWNTGLVRPDLSNKEQDIVLTMPRHPRESVAAVYSGRGWMTGYRTPDLNSNQENIGQLSVQWKDYPAYTPATVLAEAIASVPFVSVVAAEITLNGSGSLGSGITHNWTLLSAPAGSSATITTPSAPNATFTPDVAGAYTFQLAVASSSGNVTDTARAVTRAVVQP